MSRKYTLLPLRVYLSPFGIIKKLGKDARWKFKYESTLFTWLNILIRMETFINSKEWNSNYRKPRSLRELKVWERNLNTFKI